MNIVTQLQQSSKGRENLWQFINQVIGIATCCTQFWVLDNVHISHTVALSSQTGGENVSLTQLYRVYLVTCVPFVVFWKLCVCCVLQPWAQELLFRCEPVSLQPAWRRRRLWRPSPNPASLLSSSFSASPSPFASRALELLLQVWSPAGAGGVGRKRKIPDLIYAVVWAGAKAIHSCASKVNNLPCLVTWSLGFHRVLALQSCPGRSW